ncbi:MAG: helix-turn-helix domain-containing protein [Micromonosporaceae bacterium]|nr:helix-turn-helix domain-containing protein [Micromonosporaceae bacterium]
MAARFLTLDEVAEELAVTKTQVYAMVRDGELPAIKIGKKGHWRVERAKLEEYIEAKYAETAEYVRNNPLGDLSDD